ncbi:MAG TPA: hypothetical protein VFT97_02310, partial [Candidatus Eisenbacteria bacterium]|nr:hypothetical protein [Candidatus Eisenbacteria bacterium]
MIIGKSPVVEELDVMPPSAAFSMALGYNLRWAISKNALGPQQAQGVLLPNSLQRYSIGRTLIWPPTTSTRTFKPAWRS